MYYGTSDMTRDFKERSTRAVAYSSIKALYDCLNCVVGYLSKIA